MVTGSLKILKFSKKSIRVKTVEVDLISAQDITPYE